MSIPAFDTLKLARRLEEAGMPRRQAEAVAEAEAEALGEFVLSNLATKGDIAEVKQEIADLRGELHQSIAELDGKITNLRSELHQNIADLRGELHQNIAELDGKITSLRSELHQSIAEVKQDIASLRGQLGEIDARFEKLEKDFTVRFERMDRKFTLFFMVILFTMILLDQDALAFLARLFGLIR